MTTIGNFLLELVFPRYCLGCDVLLDDGGQSYLCRKCLAAVPFMHGFACAFCKSPVGAGKTCPFCRKGHFLDRLFVTTSYEHPLVEKILKSMKYRFVKSLAGDIAELMIKYSKRTHLLVMELNAGNAVVAPVPLHRLRLNRRGFNQSEVIGTVVASYFGLPFVPDLLERAESRQPQADMPDRQSRIENMKNVFRCHSNSRHGNTTSAVGKAVLLIDDVSTTGSTLDDCARALKGAGAREVWGFVFARGK